MILTEQSNIDICGIPGVPEIVSNAVITEVRRPHIANYRIADEWRFHPNRKMFFVAEGAQAITAGDTIKITEVSLLFTSVISASPTGEDFSETVITLNRQSILIEHLPSASVIGFRFRLMTAVS